MDMAIAVFLIILTVLVIAGLVIQENDKRRNARNLQRLADQADRDKRD